MSRKLYVSNLKIQTTQARISRTNIVPAIGIDTMAEPPREIFHFQSPPYPGWPKLLAFAILKYV